MEKSFRFMSHAFCRETDGGCGQEFPLALSASSTHTTYNPPLNSLIVVGLINLEISLRW